MMNMKLRKPSSCIVIKAIDKLQSCEISAWGHHIHIGRYDKLGTLGIPSPTRQVTDLSMTVLTLNASVQYDIKMQDGHQLTSAERKLHEQAKTMLDHAWKMHNQITSNKRVVEQSCVKYLQIHADVKNHKTVARNCHSV